jgi:hypothetical protein
MGGFVAASGTWCVREKSREEREEEWAEIWFKEPLHKL